MRVPGDSPGANTQRHSRAVNKNHGFGLSHGPFNSSATFLQLEILQDTFVVDFLAWYLFIFTYPVHPELILVYLKELHYRLLSHILYKEIHRANGPAHPAAQLLHVPILAALRSQPNH